MISDFPDSIKRYTSSHTKRSWVNDASKKKEAARQSKSAPYNYTSFSLQEDIAIVFPRLVTFDS
jgi:hypothetical protein